MVMRPSVASESDIEPDLATPAFVGREGDLARLAGALARRPAVVLIEGEAGIGKTRLVQELLATESSVGESVLMATCPPYLDSLTLGPIVDGIRQGHRTARPSAATNPLLGALRPLFPEWDSVLPRAPEPLEDASAARHRLFSALAELIAGMNTSVLVVEDAHWADEATLGFLLFLASRSTPDLSIVVTYRPEDVPAGSSLLRLASRHRPDVAQLRLALPPLDVTHTAGLVSSMLGGESVSEAFVAFLHEHTAGIPLVVEESVRLLRQREDVARRDGQWVRRTLDELSVPPTVRDLVLERAQRLDATVRRILTAMAVLAEPADERLVAETAGLPRSTVRPALAQAVRSGLLDDDARGRVMFRHVLMGRAIYESAPAAELTSMHLRAGQAMQTADPAPVMQLARHFRAADVPAWVTYVEQATDVAIASGDHGTAVALIDDALGAAELPASAQARLARRLLVVGARIEGVADVIRRAVRSLQDVLATATLTPVEQAEIRNPLGRLLLQLRQFDAAHAQLAEAAPHLVHDPAEAGRVMTYLGYPLPGSQPAAEHLRWLNRAAEVAGKVTGPAERLALTADRAAALLTLGDQTGWAVAAELPATVEATDEAFALTRGLANVGYCATLWGRYADAERHLARASTLVDDVEYSRMRSTVAAMQLHLDWLTGRWDGLAERAAELSDVDDDGRRDRLEAVLVTALLDAVTGARDRAVTRLRELIEAQPPINIADLPPTAAAALSDLLLADGHVEDALAATAEPIETIQRKDTWIWATDVVRARVQALMASGSLQHAAELVEQFATGLAGRGAPAPQAALGTCRALLSQARDTRSRAAEAFERAAAAWDALPRPLDALLAREQQGECLVAGGRPDTAIEVLTRVCDGFATLGARAEARRVGSRLRELGVETRPRWRGGRRGYGDALSPRETEVVRLVIAGRTNREIAQALSRSPNTVATQLNSAMRKLQVSSRTALAVRAVEAGLVVDA